MSALSYDLSEPLSGYNGAGFRLGSPLLGGCVAPDGGSPKMPVQAATHSGQT